jgi:predicted Zn-dependent protease
MYPFLLNRRQFLQLTSLTAAGWMVGCATNPVTGERQLMLVSEQQEVELDKSNAPHQFSADYGPSQDNALNAYISQTGSRLAARSHRPQMPYSFRAVNANYVNAYAFPGGSIAATRGILLNLDNEAELAALLGHELGHVNARHTAEIMSKGMLSNALIGGVVALAGSDSKVGGIAAQLGMLGSGALLARYSRDNERQADALGMEYLVKGGYSSDGMVDLMDMLKGMSQKGGSAVELLFATHPMSTERYKTAVERANSTYRAAKGQPLYRERYMDQTARLRQLKPAIEAMQKGEAALGKEDVQQAQQFFSAALKKAPDDYTGLVLMAKCQLAQKKFKEADGYLKHAQEVYPQESQAHFLAGFVELNQKQFNAALAQFEKYDKQLPGNPSTTFFKGYAYEGMEQRKPAAENYYQYLQAVNQGDNAQHAYNRLVEWGYIKKKQ